MERNDFWKHNELFKRAMADGNTNEARHELYQMTQLYGTMIDNDLTGNKAILHAALSLDKVIVDFNMAYFVPFAMRLADTDWEGTRRGGRVIPSIGQRITNRLMSNIQSRSDTYIKAIMPFFRKALQINPSNKDNLRHLAQLYVRVAMKSQAILIYKRLLRHHNDSYLFAELAELMPTLQARTALYAQAVVHQSKERFNTNNRYHLAQLLQLTEPTRAAYEITKCIAAREKANEPISSDVSRIARLLAEFTPVTDDDQQTFYERQARIANAIINENE